MIKQVNFLLILYFLEDLRLINQPCFKLNHNNIKEDIEDIYCFEVNTKYISSSSVEKSVITKC